MDPVRQRLAADRTTTLARISSLTRELAGVREATALVATDDEHDPEGASTAFEREQLSALLAQASTRVDELDAALARFEAGTYGRCDHCGGAIAPGRLEARPAARTCIGCAADPRGRKTG